MLTLILRAGMLPVVTAEVPLDELSRAPVQGLHSGFPYLHGAGLPGTGYGEHAQANEYTKPALELGAHVAPLGMALYRGKQLTADYRNRVESVEPFISGWLNEKTNQPGPIDGRD